MNPPPNLRFTHCPSFFMDILSLAILLPNENKKKSYVLLIVLVYSLLFCLSQYCRLMKTKTKKQNKSKNKILRFTHCPSLFIAVLSLAILSPNENKQKKTNLRFAHCPSLFIAILSLAILSPNENKKNLRFAHSPSLFIAVLSLAILSPNENKKNSRFAHSLSLFIAVLSLTILSPNENSFPILTHRQAEVLSYTK